MFFKRKQAFNINKLNSFIKNNNFVDQYIGTINSLKLPATVNAFRLISSK